LTRTSSGTTTNSLTGGNTFHSLSLSHAGTGTLVLANTTGDTYNGNVTFTRSNGTINVATNGENNFNGNITVSSATAGGVSFGSGTGYVNITGNTTQNYTASQTHSCGRLRMNTTGTLSLNSPLNIGTEADFVSGIINPTSSTNTLIFQNGSTASSASDVSHVNGAVQKVGTNAFTFPIGKGGVYAPLGIGTSASSSTFRAEYFGTNFPTLAPFASPLVKVSYCEYWDLTRTAGTGAPLVTLSWGSPRSCGVSVLADMRVAHWTGSTWEHLGNSATTGTAASGTVTASIPSSSYSPFTLGSTSGDNTLPLTLLDFSATAVGSGSIELSWNTASELNFSHFVLERKTQSGFDSIGLVLGKGISPSSYFWVDTDPEFGANYYRLKMVDLDGSFSYSKVISATLAQNQTSASQAYLYPNPTQGKMYLVSQESGIYLIKNLLGAVIKSGSLEGKSPFEIDLSNLPSGIYLLETPYKTTKFVLE
jgi:hypothetical protein